MVSDQIDIYTIFSHPLRRLILAYLYHWQGEEGLSSTQIANTAGEPLSNISYHARVLLDRGGIDLWATKPVRGSAEHFYRLGVRLWEVPWAKETILREAKPPEPITLDRRPLDQDTFLKFGREVLDASERKIIALHFGFTARPKMGRREIGEILGMKTELVRQVERIALTKLERARREAAET